MSASILTPIEYGKARLLKDVTAAGKGEHARAHMAHDLGELVRGGGGLPREWWRTGNELLDRIARREAEDAYDAMEQARSHFSAVLRLVDQVDQIREATEDAGFPVENAAGLARTLAKW